MRKIVFFLFLIICMISLIVYDNFYGNTVIKILESDIFKVENVVYEGDFIYTKDDIKPILDSLKGKSLLYVDERKIENLVNSDIRIESFDIIKNYPSNIVVKVQEKDLIGLNIVNKKVYLVDKELSPVITLDEKIKIDRKNNLDSNLYMVLTYKNDKEKEELKQILSVLMESKLKTEVSEILKIDEKWNIILNDNIKVITTLNVDLKKYNFAYDIYKKEVITEYIDIRFEDITTK